MKNNFKKFKKGPLIASLLFLLSAVAVFIFLHQKITSNIEVSMVREAELQTETSKKNESKSYERLLKLVETERAQLDTHFIKSTDVVVFLDTVEDLAPRVNAKAEVALVDIAPDSTSLNVEMKASGTFEALYRFLMLLENLPYQVEIVSMNLQRPGAAGEAVSGSAAVEWSATFQIKLLSFVK